MRRVLSGVLLACALAAGCDTPPEEVDLEEVVVEPPPSAREIEDTAVEPHTPAVSRAAVEQDQEISRHLLSPEQIAALEAEAEQAQIEPEPVAASVQREAIRIERPEPQPEPAPVVRRPEPEPTPVVRHPTPAPEPAPVVRRRPAPPPEPEDDGLAEVELPDEPEPVRSVFDGSCDPAELEPAAVDGDLDGAQIKCLTASLHQATQAAEREALSLVLVTQARASGDVQAWEARVVHHLTEVDPSNPALAYRYALHTFDKGPGHAQEALEWADQALTHRAAWTGDAYNQRVEGLFKLRAAAAQILWRESVDAYQNDPVDWRKEEVETARLFTLGCARDWYTFAAATGQEVAMAKRLCGLAGDEACDKGT